MIIFPRYLQIALLTLTISGCTAIGINRYNDLHGQPQLQERMVAVDSAIATQYRNEVQPILESRCISCHACYEAPCQLNLNSPAGIDRGLSKMPVYKSTRLRAAPPTRLFIDAESTAEWRNMKFSPVLNERTQTPANNRMAGLLYQSLELKTQHPLPTDTVLSDKDFDFSINRPNSCPSTETYPSYAAAKPLSGMPYGLPGLSKQEQAVLTAWIDNGAKMSGALPLAADLQQQINEWESFLNEDAAKTKLVARYIYEHLFLASLYFADSTSSAAPGEIFKLVRSITPPGEAIRVIATRRASSDPEVPRAYYRLQRSEAGLVSKTYLPYRLSHDRLAWVKDLFMTPDYAVDELPGYEREYINPFVTFKDIPAQARYRFMLEDAKFIIQGFIKGPVCRGQVAIDVINDQFWVFFVDPDTDAIPMTDGFISMEAANLQLPGNDGSNARLLGHWQRYSKLNNEYLMAKRDRLNKIFDGNMNLNENLVWDGDGDNPNAALTVFRNFDNAAVIQGLIGNSPKTAWIIDYPLFERIHYLLTVDFDVFGNAGHQLNTRLYMDFLRIEGEYNFLALMPSSKRLAIRDYWYRDATIRVRRFLNSSQSYLNEEPSISYVTNDPKTELFGIIKDRLGPALNKSFSTQVTSVPTAERNSLRDLQTVGGLPVNLLAETTLLRVIQDDGSAHLYTLLANRAHSNVTSLFFEKSNLLPEEDTLTVTNGVVGDYPNALMQIPANKLDDFVMAVGALATEQDYFALLNTYGVRRTNPAFWQHSDVIHANYRQQQPTLAGWLDYSRLENR